MSSTEPGSAHWMSSSTRTTGPVCPIDESSARTARYARVSISGWSATTMSSWRRLSADTSTVPSAPMLASTPRRKRNRPVHVSFLSPEEFAARPELIRTKANLVPQGLEVVRVIDIEGLDRQADGGTHVASTGEVGTVYVVGHQSKGKGNKRLRIALDPVPASPAHAE